jgi:hypothetical protein
MPLTDLLSGRKAPAFPLAVLQPAPFEFRGIRIGDEMKEANRKFLSWKIPSLSSKPGLCGSDGITRIETCTDVLDTGLYVNMTILDQRVAEIYAPLTSRTGKRLRQLRAWAGEEVRPPGQARNEAKTAMLSWSILISFFQMLRRQS